MLRVRLYGAESGRIAGAWVLPGRSLTAGWLTLDLPEPVGPIRETAWLEVKADLGAFDRLALSLAAEPVRRQRRGDRRRRGGAAGAGLRAVDRAARAAAGAVALLGRRGDRPSGAADRRPAELPQQVWQSARMPEGKVERVAIGTQPARLVASLAPGEHALAVLPAVPLNGLDLLQAELAVALGDAAWLEAALWLQPEGTTIGLEAELSTTAPGARWSGWYPGCSATAPAGLRSPCRPTAAAAVVALVLRKPRRAPEGVLRVEIARLFGTRAAQPPPKAGPPRPGAAAHPAWCPAAAPVAAAVRLLERYLAARRQLPAYRPADGGRPRRRARLAAAALQAGGNGVVPSFCSASGRTGRCLFKTWPSGPSDAGGPYLCN